MNEQTGDIEFVYKYRSIDLNGHTKKIFTHSELYFNRPLDFNDPFDCRPKFSTAASEEQIKNYLMERFPKYMPDLTSRQQKRAKARGIIKQKRFQQPEFLEEIKNNYIERDLNEVGICCFSEIPDHILMWSHYAQSHQGLCLQFEGTSFTPFFGLAQKVHYQMEYPIVNPIVDEPNNMVNAALLTKAKFWEYEKEWRIVIVPEGFGVQKFQPESLKGVILGAKISKENSENVISWAKERNRPIQIYKTQLKEGEYGIDIKPYISIE